MSLGWGSGGGSIRMSGYGRDDDDDSNYEQDNSNDVESSSTPTTSSAVLAKDKQNILQSSVKVREDAPPQRVAKPVASIIARPEATVRVVSIDSEAEMSKSGSKKIQPNDGPTSSLRFVEQKEGDSSKHHTDFHGNQHGSLSLSQKLYDSQENLLSTTAKTGSSTEQLQQLFSQDQIAAFMKAGRGHLIPGLTPIEDIMGAIAVEYRWSPDELSSDLAAILKYRIRNAKAARALSETGWLEMKNLLPVTKDLVRHAVGWSANASLSLSQ
ncbi:hypothetical protein BJ741DRAFT_593909 [Chytriomyces cf. hyalinus JEL632]|nr:hypothetical protein BJ741DRAFT_593909 [Chytriomyces cf. hyalinus JEL632]